MRVKLVTSSKINLFLDIINKREDGFHNIQSLFMEVFSGDEILLTDTDNLNNIEINSNLKELRGKNNIIYKLWIELKKRYNFKKGIKIYLDKKIPIGSGLGSGSGDVVHTLSGLEKLFNLTISKDEKIKICEKIGSDVPFFIEGGMQTAEGKGEILTPILTRSNTITNNTYTDSDNDLNTKLNILIMCPDIIISTKEAYKELNLKQQNKNYINQRLTQNKIKIDNLVKGIIEKNYKLINENLYNKFEETIFIKNKEINIIKNDLMNYGAVGSLMSGSGSAVFGIFFDKELMLNAYKHLIKKSYKCFMTIPNIKINGSGIFLTDKT